jgi:hypothetical protein
MCTGASEDKMAETSNFFAITIQSTFGNSPGADLRATETAWMRRFSMNMSSDMALRYLMGCPP